MKELTIVIAGHGAVGKAVEHSLATAGYIDTYVDDPGQDKRLSMIGIVPDGVVVAVATPMSEDGSCFTGNVCDVFLKYGTDTKYLVKSAVDPLFLKEQTYYGYDITVSPEFLRGTTGSDPTKDFMDQKFAMYGGGSMRWWHELFKPFLPKLEKVSFTSLEQAAFAKYVENNFLATKVTFFNEMYQIFNACGFDDFDVMVDAICNDERIGHSHTQVPGPDGKFGFGGHCLPKDMAALRSVALAVGIDSPLLDALTDINFDNRKR